MWKNNNHIPLQTHAYDQRKQGQEMHHQLLLNIPKSPSCCLWSAICPLFFSLLPSILLLPALWFSCSFMATYPSLWESLKDLSSHFVDEQYCAISNKRCEPLNATEGQLWTTHEGAEQKETFHLEGSQRHLSEWCGSGWFQVIRNEKEMCVLSKQRTQGFFHLRSHKAVVHQGK